MSDRIGSNAHPEPASPDAAPDGQPVRSNRMALAAVLLSIFAFILPFGIAAVVLGHLSKRRIDACRGTVDGKATARAALIIAYVQMFLVTVAALISWQVLHLTVQDFRRDPLVQRVFREADARAPLDSTSAREEEITARALVIQMVAIQDQNYRNNGAGYFCSIGELVQTGVEGATPAERQAFGERLHQSAYMFELSGCSSGSVAARYDLTAVPRLPRMPAGSLLYCADETGKVSQIRNETSVNCFDHGYVIVQPSTPEIENSPKGLVRPVPPEQPPAPCLPSEKIPCKQ
jgi:hypothetical protein